MFNPKSEVMSARMVSLLTYILLIYQYLYVSAGAVFINFANI
ncbi:hypothetical protein Mpsy_2156 [Methanolobus psychrophilus R15]|nr:hypothetical protein Mpsy_2156 [Methanolobus psychrophilus R15]